MILASKMLQPIILNTALVSLFILAAGCRGKIESDTNSRPNDKLSEAVLHADSIRFMRRQQLAKRCFNEDDVYHFKEHPFSFTDGKRYRILLFNSCGFTYEGGDPHKIVITNEEYEVKTSGRFYGVVQASSVRSQNSRTILELQCFRRPNVAYTLCYEISPNQILQIPRSNSAKAEQGRGADDSNR